MPNTAIFNRIEKNYKKLKSWADKNHIEAFRIYDRDMPDYPYVVDKYGDYVLLNDRRQEIDFNDPKKQNHFDEIKAALTEILKPKELIIKKRAPQRAENNEQYEKLGASNKRISVQEGHLKFLVNLWDYIDTGLFLDHRYLRQMVGKWVQPEQRVLNLFAYTGSFSVYAASAGALVTTVDLSNTYTQWAHDNFRANQLDPQKHFWIVEDVMEYLAKNHMARYDWIILDPPTYSNSKSMKQDFEVEKDQEFLVDSCMKILTPNGRLIFSNNKRSFKLSPSLSEKYLVKDLSEKTLPFDIRDPKTRYVYEIQRKP